MDKSIEMWYYDDILQKKKGVSIYMTEKTIFKLKKILVLALKIGVGGSLAYYLAERILHLQFASSAGIITLLTLQTTKWDTFKLAYRRVLTFFLTYGTCLVLYYVIRASWFDYGVYLLLMVAFCEWLGWRNAISVNAVIGAHFLSSHDFSLEFMINEFMLVLIGISVALILNLFHIYNTHESGIVKCMRYTENEMKKILVEIAGYLRCQEMGENVWHDIKALENRLDEFLDLAHEHQNNTFATHPEYYINYFNLRMQQCGILHNLHAEMTRLRMLPKQAEVIADFIEALAEHIHEMLDPKEMMEYLQKLLDDMKKQALPQSRGEFESRALLYHVIMDLEDFLRFKQRFIEGIDEEQFLIYWNKESESD